MALDDISRRVVHTGDGAQTAFPFAFSIFQEDQVEVYYASETVDEMIVPIGDYSVELSEDGTGGTVIFEVAPEAGSRIAILSKVPYTQEMALTNYGGFDPVTLNDNADFQAAQIQQLREVLDRCIKLHPTDNMTAEEFMEAFFRAAEMTRQYMDIARYLSFSFQIPNGSVCAFYNVTVVNRNPVFWGTTTPDETWLLCDGGPDGASGTVPDLVGKMIRGSMPADQGQQTGHDKIRLTYDQIPPHSHPTVMSGIGGYHTHTAGSLNVKGTFGADSPNYEPTGCFYNAGSQGYGQKDRGGGMIVGFDASRGFEGVTSVGGAHSHTVLMGSAGNGQEVDIRPVTYTLAYFVRVPRDHSGPSDWTRPLPDDPISPYNVGDIIYGDFYDPVTRVTYQNYNYIIVDKDVDAVYDGGETGKIALLQAQNLLPWTSTYGPQAFYICPNGLPAGTYHVYNYGPNYINFYFTLTQDVIPGGSLYYDDINKAEADRQVRVYAPDGISILERVRARNGTQGTRLQDSNLNDSHKGLYGSMQWSISAIRQYLNSDAPAGGWWRKMNPYCVAPDELFDRAGYLASLPPNLVRMLRSVRITTGIDSSGSEVTFDRVWIPLAEEMCFSINYYTAPRFPEQARAYWKEQIGAYHQVDNNTVIEELIARPINSEYAPEQMPAEDYYTRSVGAFTGLGVYTGSPALVVGISSSGSVYRNNATYGKRNNRPILAIG